MKKGVVIVNTARGAVMDESALVKALDSGHVASVGLDVYENEPQIDPGLLANPHVMLVPHMGTYTVEVSYAFSISASILLSPGPREASREGVAE
jgi:lactate dehydrogenase-like 2-hydroxyacid dehydrogenase